MLVNPCANHTIPEKKKKERLDISGVTGNLDSIILTMASVVLRCASRSLNSTLRNIAAGKALNIQRQAIRSYSLSRQLLGG